MELRKAEIEQVVSALQSGQSMLVLGEPGAGKTTVGERVSAKLGAEGYTVAIASYSGSAKETLIDIAECLDVPLVTDDEKPKQLTAQQLRESLLGYLTKPKVLLIADDAHRWTASLRYWLEDVLRGKGLLLLLATNPPPKDIFVKLPLVELPPLKDDEIRTLMQLEASAHEIKLGTKEFAELQQRAGNNPALAKRVVHEAMLGISETQSTEHYQYIDGTLFLIALLTCLGIVRLIGLGMGDKMLYVLGGVLTLAALILRSLLYAANRRSRKL
jgi:replication-associated recombination protein RarA